MKFALLTLGFLSLAAFSSPSEAATCRTESRGIRFEAYDRNERRAERRVVRACKDHRATRDRECERNVRCWDDRRPNPPPRDPRDPRDPRPNPPRDRVSRDGQCYLNRYPDICQNSPQNYCRDPEAHYRDHGRREGRIWGCR